MKKTIPFALISSAFILACSPSKENDQVVQNNDSISFTYSVEPSSVVLPKGLQSYSLGINSDKNWVIIGGRTNGLHNFSTPSFPVKKANSFIYIFNPEHGLIDSFNVFSLIKQTKQTHIARIVKQFISTNIQHTQVGKYLYLCGGYGLDTSIVSKNANYITHNIVSKVDLDKLTNAIIEKDMMKLVGSVLTDTCSQLAVTGGELFKLNDGNFYLAVGHNFNGEYGNAGGSGVQPTQNYTLKVSVFNIQETDNSIKVEIDTTKQIPSTPQEDSTSIFRRRDLVVAPTVNTNGTVGLGLFGGVFKYKNSIANAGFPFRTPIYISTQTMAGNEYYFHDEQYIQPSNLYSAANIAFYSPSTNTMLTSIFGGLVNDATIHEDSVASWTKKILTISRQLNTNTYTNILNPTELPGFLGAEALFVANQSIAENMFYNDTLNIFNYDNIPSGQKFLLGYMVGGINSSGKQGPTSAGNVIYTIYINK